MRGLALGREQCYCWRENPNLDFSSILPLAGHVA